MRAIELLGNEVIVELRKSNPAALEQDDFGEQLTRECTVYVLRLLVLKFAESR